MKPWVPEGMEEVPKTRWNRDGFEIPSSGGRGVGFAK